MTIWKRTIGPECGPDDQYECCGCGRVLVRAEVEPRKDGWWCRRCLAEEARVKLITIA
jgi:hypothetical protein